METLSGTDIISDFADADVKVTAQIAGQQITLTVKKPALSRPDQDRVQQRLLEVLGVGSAPNTGEGIFVLTVANRLFDPQTVATSAMDAVINAIGVPRDRIIVETDPIPDEPGWILVVTSQPHTEDLDLLERITIAANSFVQASLTTDRYGFRVKPRKALGLDLIAERVREVIVAHYRQAAD